MNVDERGLFWICFRADTSLFQPRRDLIRSPRLNDTPAIFRYRKAAARITYYALRSMSFAPSHKELADLRHGRRDDNQRHNDDPLFKG
jgi:hypothetical protein